jgi:prepilin-type N-terminal cleavage/methylation domain-containing protein
MRTYGTNRRAFSLIELVIVIIILGVISAIAVPRMIRAGEGADVTSLQADLQVLRGAIEMYRYEHSAFPTVAAFENQLTLETDAAGTPTVGGGYGPYVFKIPPLKTGNQKGETGIAATSGTPAAETAGAVGWLYDEDTGNIWANDANHFDK